MHLKDLGYEQKSLKNLRSVDWLRTYLHGEHRVRHKAYSEEALYILDQYHASRERKIRLLCTFDSPWREESWSLVSDPENA